MTGDLKADADEITDARVGDHDCDITISDGTTTSLYTFTITITNVNDAPTLTVTADGSGTFAEDGSAEDLYSSVTVADNDATLTNLYTELKLTVTLVTDTTEYLNVNGGACDLTNANSETTTLGGSDLTCAVSLTLTTATVTLSHAGLTDAQLQTLVDGLSYENTDQTPTAAARVITITELTDSGGSAGASDDDVVPTNAASTVTVSATNDAPTSNGGAPGTEPNEDATYTFTVTEAHWGYSDTESDAMHSVDITTLPGTGTLMYDSSAVEAGDDITAGNLGGLTYVPVGNANGAVTFTFKTYDGTAWQSAAATYTMTYAAVNDLPESSGGAPGTEPAEDATYTFTVTEAHWGYDDPVEDSAMATVDITTLPGTGTLRYGGSDVIAGADIAAASLGGLTYVPVANANGAVTF
ncbi:uncharacterized protein METZ01_LOCUS269028, partial [marine metagenome]